MIRFRAAILPLALFSAACTQEPVREEFIGTMVIGPHGPEFSPLDRALQFPVPGEPDVSFGWRMSGREPEFNEKIATVQQQADQRGLPQFALIRVSFSGTVTPPDPEGDDPHPHVYVAEWIELEPCPNPTDERTCFD